MCPAQHVDFAKGRVTRVGNWGLTATSRRSQPGISSSAQLKNSGGRLEPNSTVEGLTVALPQASHTIGVDADGAASSSL